MIIAVDIETSCDGEAEFQTWRKNFRIDSLACSWRTETGEIRSWFSDKPSEVNRMIHRLASEDMQLVVHNLSFEQTVFKKLYSSLKFNWFADTMRLAQLDDNAAGVKWENFTIKTADDIMDEMLGVAESDGPPPAKTTGLSLVACAARYLPAERHNHKDKAHKWLEEHHKITSNHGSHLHLLPYEQLKEYNMADTEVTLLLYETLDELLKLKKFDWQQDWVLYTNRVDLMGSAYLKGLKIDRKRLRQEIYKLDAQIKDVEREFFTKTVAERSAWALANPGKIKSRPALPESFNIGSNTQLKQLFMGVMGVVGGKYTKTGLKKVESGDLTAAEAALQYPSFASKHLSTWGPLGEILYKRRKLLLVLQQMLGVLLASEADGRVHPEVRAAGTRTNRVAGGKGIE